MRVHHFFGKYRKAIFYLVKIIIIAWTYMQKKNFIGFEWWLRRNTIFTKLPMSVEKKNQNTKSSVVWYFNTSWINKDSHQLKIQMFYPLLCASVCTKNRNRFLLQVKHKTVDKTLEQCFLKKFKATCKNSAESGRLYSQPFYCSGSPKIN